MFMKWSINLISGLSLVTIIVIGIMYMSFKNEFVFQDITIDITNNPVDRSELIEFVMVGSKKHECASTRVYGTAYNADGTSILLDKYAKQYVRNTRPGESVPNTWALYIPKEMYSGEWRVSMTGEFLCNYSIFQLRKIQSYDNILLIVE